MPEKNSVILPHVDLLTYEELLRVVCLAVQLGMNKIRLTGGRAIGAQGYPPVHRQTDQDRRTA